MTLPAVHYPVALADVPQIWRGAPFEWELHFDGVDLTGYGTTWAAMLRSSMDDQDHVDFVVELHLTSGYIVLSLTAAQTLALQRGEANYGFDVIATGGSTSPFPVWTGRVSVDGNWTR